MFLTQLLTDSKMNKVPVKTLYAEARQKSALNF